MKFDDQPIPQRDGASQSERRPPALDPAYAPVDERSVSDLLRFAQQYARELHYFDEQNQKCGNWSGFLAGDMADLARYLRDPHGAYAPPHVVLLLTFLGLLQQTQAQINGLTRRHLEFYYREALRLSARPALPDHVHVLVELARGQRSLLLPAGSLLAAGQDSRGLDLCYRTDHDFVATRARVASLKSLSVRRQVIGLREVRHDPRQLIDLFPADSKLWDDLPIATHRFMAMLALTLGDGGSIRALPTYPVTAKAQDATASLPKVLEQLDRLIAFICDKKTGLAMPLPAFRTLITLKREREQNDEQLWKEINVYIEKAGQAKRGNTNNDLKITGRDLEANLRTALELKEEDFKKLFATMPEVNTIYDLYRLRERPEIRKFIENDLKLFMSFADFTTMMGKVDQIFSGWRRIYDILRSAAQRKQPGQVLTAPNLRGNVSFDSLVQLTRKEDKDLAQLKAQLKDLGVADLDQCYSQLEALDHSLYMSVEEFAAIRAIDRRGDAAQDWEWEQVYTILAQAWAKGPQRPQAQLKQIHTACGFAGLIRAALGDPEPDDPFARAGSFETLNPVTDAQYISERLCLELENFKFICQTQIDQKPLGDAAWDTVYKMLDLAQRRRSGVAPQIVRLTNIYAAADATQVQVRSATAANTTARWRTFGADQDSSGAAPAALGLALASPLLALAEGKRTITLTLGFDPASFDKEAIKALLKQRPVPLRILFSAAAGMVEILPDSQAPLDEAPLTISAEVVGQGDKQTATLVVTLRLKADAPAVAPLRAVGAIGAPWPVLQVRLADLPERREALFLFQPLILRSVKLAVEVSEITQLTLQNDERILDARQPFEPFGVAPLVGSSFAIAHPEICTKRLSSLDVQIEWLGAPDLAKHYASYENYTTKPITDASFKVQARLYDRRSLFDIGNAGKTLFIQVKDKPTLQISQTELDSISGYQHASGAAGGDEALDWGRYWLLELLEPDFQHAIYPYAAAQCALKQIILKPPYTPKIKRMSLGYSASEQISLDGSSLNKLYHIEPFGYRELAPELGDYYMLPQPRNEGEIYIGIADLAPPQSLALLFQLAEGSADPSLAREAVRWHYLDGNHWKSLEQGRLVSDTTSGLLNTGIITFELPLAAPGTLMPTGLYWLRASIARNSRCIADLVAVEAQALSATFVDQGNAPDHLDQPLPPARISGLAEPRPEIQAIRQPYSSFGGKGIEEEARFYTRVSERLRHKGRALTSWDYERLILETFPTIYKARCLPAGSADDPRLAEQVRIIVIPDIRGRPTFDPFEPGVAADTLQQIEQHLSQHVSPSVRFSVGNPAYLRLRVRLGVRLRSGYSPGYYLQLLDQEIQRFLAPWAYDQSAEIVFGGQVNASLIVNFAEERPYVDYVAGIKLFKSEPGTDDFVAVEPEFPVAHDAILVSDRRHIIDLIADEVFQQIYFTGIGYMQLDDDFIVG